MLCLGSSIYPYPFKFGKFISRRFAVCCARKGNVKQYKTNKQNKNKTNKKQLFSFILFLLLTTSQQLGATRILADKCLDEIRYNQQEEFTKFSVSLFEALAAKSDESAESQNLIARNKLLGFQNFDFNLIKAPFRVTFTDKHLKLEPRTYVLFSFFLY